ncbi:hypothetical protein IEU95_13080 [Hoyosella rhizosphaerae]|nr:hypothetical protein [Hoyosella rhizosphaerae]MBN4927771.1 hypothetical protein [Hoyosella rhizosphaerae]
MAILWAVAITLIAVNTALALRLDASVRKVQQHARGTAFNELQKAAIPFVGIGLSVAYLANWIFNGTEQFRSVTTTVLLSGIVFGVAASAAMDLLARVPRRHRWVRLVGAMAGATALCVGGPVAGALTH